MVRKRKAITTPNSDTTRILQVMAHPARLRLLSALGDGEECVCHLIAMLDRRQAYVSQQLMLLREAGLIQDRKVGYRVYYRLRDPRIRPILRALSEANPPRRRGQSVLTGCHCPKCRSKKG